MKKLVYYILLCLIAYSTQAQKKGLQAPLTMGEVKLIFQHHYNGRPLVLHDSTYTNQMGEIFTLRKLKYYVGRMMFFSEEKKVQRNYYFLINEEKPASKTITLMLPERDYDSLHILFGVDSNLNVAGAQTGPLDPANDMFWTWNSGYVMQKLEGQSPQSKAINQKIEYHLGGYSGPNRAQQLRAFYFTSPMLQVKKNITATVRITADFNGFWQGDFSISSQPVCNTAGEQAGRLAQRFCQLFVADVQ